MRHGAYARASWAADRRSTPSLLRRTASGHGQESASPNDALPRRTKGRLAPPGVRRRLGALFEARSAAPRGDDRPWWASAHERLDPPNGFRVRGPGRSPRSWRGTRFVPSIRLRQCLRMAYIHCLDRGNSRVRRRGGCVPPVSLNGVSMDTAGLERHLFCRPRRGRASARENHSDSRRAASRTSRTGAVLAPGYVGLGFGTLPLIEHARGRRPDA